MAEPKKKIIIKKKMIMKKKASKPPVKALENDGLPEDVVAPKLKVPSKSVPITKKNVQITKKKVQVTKKKATGTAVKEAPPPEVVSTSEIEAQQPPPPAERQKTMITEPPLGAPSHEDEPTAIKKKEAFKFYCIRCGQKLEAYYDWVGRSIGCPRCKASIKIPEPLQ
jgi:DNA-directed RNA polymerase subunit M/transcription elongation factor TFIIS